MKRNFTLIAALAALVFITSSCITENDPVDTWSLYYEFPSTALLGDYVPNPDTWEDDLPADGVYNGCYIHHIPMTNVSAYVHRWTNQDLDNLQFELSGMPSSVSSVTGSNFTGNVYYSYNSYSFSLNSDFDITVYKNNSGGVRLHGCIRKLHKPNAVWGYDVVDEWNYYYFDIVK